MAAGVSNRLWFGRGINCGGSGTLGWTSRAGLL